MNDNKEIFKRKLLLEKMSLLKAKHGLYVKNVLSLNSSDECILGVVVQLRNMSIYSMTDESFLSHLSKNKDNSKEDTKKTIDKFSSDKYKVITFEEFCGS